MKKLLAALALVLAAVAASAGAVSAQPGSPAAAVAGPQADRPARVADLAPGVPQSADPSGELGADAGATADTGTFGPAEEPTWIAPVLVAAVVLLAIGVLVSSRRWKDHDRL